MEQEIEKNFDAAKEAIRNACDKINMISRSLPRTHVESLEVIKNMITQDLIRLAYTVNRVDSEIESLEFRALQLQRLNESEKEAI